MGKIGDFFSLLSLKLAVTWTNFREYLQVVRRYYGHPLFRKIDIFLLRCYLQRNPYTINKEFLEQLGEKNIYAYGETPLTTLEKIADECGIAANDVVYELGSGRGRSCFWLHCFKGCRVVGVEFVPDFVAFADKAKRKFGIDSVSFLFRDILYPSYSDATVLYFYGTSSETSFILKLIDKLKKLPKGTKIITVSYPLTTFCPEPVFEIVKTFSAEFTWGPADVYLQVRT